MSLDYWILQDRKPIKVGLYTWGKWFKKVENRKIAKTEVDGVCVSTVFLGINYNWHDDGPPLLFETMVFGGPLNQHCWRYSTLEAAELGHEATVNEVRRATCV